MNVPVKIPHDGKILIVEGQTVDFTTPLIKRKGSTSVEIPLAETMGFAPDKIFLKVKKSIGDTVTNGELLAEDKTFMSSKRYVSHVDGVLKEINHERGTVIITQDGGESSEILCYFQGEVASVNDGYIDLKVKGAYKAEILEGVEFMGGQIFYAPPAPIPFSEEDIKGKSIFSKTVNPMDHSKIEALGAEALIMSEKSTPQGTLTQIILHQGKDFDTVHNKQYPFFIVAPEENTLYFYD